MIIKNKLSFKASPIYPDNSHIRWEIDGKGYIGNKVVFHLHEINDDEGYLVNVINQDNQDVVEQSPIFWESIEWSKTPNNTRFNHNARRTAMQWAEDYLLNIVTNQLSLS